MKHKNSPEVPFHDVSKWAETCFENLAQYEGSIQKDLLTNSVRQLSYEMFHQLENGEIDHMALDALAKHISDQALIKRAGRFAANHPDSDLSQRIDQLLSSLQVKDFEDFRAALTKTRVGIVFTAHPTFSMSKEMRETLVDYASARSDAEREAAKGVFATLPHMPDASIRLVDEHEAVQAAIKHTQAQFRLIVKEILNWAWSKYPENWTELIPQPMSLASWVGYDLDGRTDIHWGETFRIRLEEKTVALQGYAKHLQDITANDLEPEINAIAQRLTEAAELTQAQAIAFSGDLNDPKIVTQAANCLTHDDPRKLIDLEDIISDLGMLIMRSSDKETQLSLSLLRAEMKAYGLGISRIHLRINAAQVRSAMRIDFDLDQARGFSDRTTLERVARQVASAKPININTASIFTEQMTARRQLMLCVQFAKHIDVKTPIRFLIAECEAPATVMGAIYLARLYGVAHLIDISPLFETPEAIERGGRFVERLLTEPEYIAYIRQRGRMAIQIGFSDSGRFMGQIGANLAIERLQILLARTLAAQNIRDVEVLIFNTHGESMGRGGFPGSLQERFDYLLSPWTRARYAKEGLDINAECSFQGGDGYLHFNRAPLARSSLLSLLEWGFQNPENDKKDRFYSDINYSWDFYRGVVDWQKALFENADYHQTIGAFASSFLPVTGSRKARRQSGNTLIGPKSLRAIPHNAILQQMAIPANIFGGVGHAMGTEAERLVDHIRGSARASGIMDMIWAARKLTSLPVLRAYAALYDAKFWIGKAGIGGQSKSTLIAMEIADYLINSETPIAINRLANHLASDLVKLDGVLGEVYGDNTRLERHEARRSMHVLHAIRQAFIMRAFMIVGELPPFSPRHDVTRKSVFDMAFALRFNELADLLSEIFPAHQTDLDALKDIEEIRDEEFMPLNGYPELHAQIIEPLRATHASIHQISIGLSHFYGAFG